MTLPAFALARPTSLTEALQVLSEDNVAYCGGTELLLAMKVGLLRPRTLVDIKRLGELRGIAVDGDELVVGAATSHDAVATDSSVRERAPLLADVCRRVGNARVRAQGTVGGNVCFAEPRSDVTTALVALGASVTLHSASGQRRLPIDEFLIGAYETARRADELMVDVRVPLPTVRRSAYLKFQVTERPTVGVAVCAPEDGRRGRLVVGAVVDRPLLVECDQLSDIDPMALAEMVDPVSDLFGSEEYKRHMTEVYVRRAVGAVSEMAS